MYLYPSRPGFIRPLQTVSEGSLEEGSLGWRRRENWRLHQAPEVPELEPPSLLFLPGDVFFDFLGCFDLV